MLNVGVQIFQKTLEERGELAVIWRHILQLVKIFFDLQRSALPCDFHEATLFSLMLFMVDISQIGAFLSHVLLHGRIHSQLFTDGMACKSPGGWFLR